MCDPFFRLHTHLQLSQPKVLWRCGVCGRESRIPRACCTRPDAVSVSRPGAKPVVLPWLRQVGSRVLTSVRAILPHRHRAAVDRPMATAEARRGDAVRERVAVGSLDDSPWREAHTDTAAVAETTHVSV